MTTVSEICAECGYKELCMELEYELNCQDRDGCSHYEAFLEGEEIQEYVD